MVKVPVKRKPKQKIKQKVKVSQNVKVIVGDVKRKRAVKSNTKTSPAKPPIVLNISNPQPMNNMFIEYFRNQLQNQQPIHANTLLQHERLNEKEENKASKVGALAKIDQEPNDVAREMRRQKSETIERIRIADAERKDQEKDMKLSIRRIPNPTNQSARQLASFYSPQRTPAFNIQQESSSEAESVMLQALEQQRLQAESAIEKGGAGDGAGTGTEDGGTSGEIEAPGTPIRKYTEPVNPIKEERKNKSRKGRKKLSNEVIQARLEEEARLRRERIGMEAEDPKPRRGPKRLPQEEIYRRRRARQLDATFNQIFKGPETEEDA